MGVHYKPSQWRGKRLVYRSNDPSEPKQEAKRVIAALAFVVLILLLGSWLLSRWAAS